MALKFSSVFLYLSWFFTSAFMRSGSDLPTVMINGYIKAQPEWDFAWKHCSEVVAKQIRIASRTLRGGWIRPEQCYPHLPGKNPFISGNLTLINSLILSSLPFFHSLLQLSLYRKHACLHLLISSGPRNIVGTCVFAVWINDESTHPWWQSLLIICHFYKGICSLV